MKIYLYLLPAYIFMFSSPLFSQDKADSTMIFIEVILDSTQNKTTGYDRYFDSQKNRKLVKNISHFLDDALSIKFEDFHYKVKIYYSWPDSASEKPINNNALGVRCLLFVDDNYSLVIKLIMKDFQSNREFEKYKLILKNEYLNKYTWWSKLEQPGIGQSELDQILYHMSSSIVSQIVDEIFQWVMESGMKIRVEIDEIKNIGDIEKHGKLAKQIKSILITELSNSENIAIFSEDSLSNLPVNYIINGEYFNIEKQIRIDLRCKRKAKVSRIITSRKAIINSLNISDLSSTMSDLCYYLKRAMVTDFKKSIKSIAVIGRPPGKLFAFKSDDPMSTTITGEIVHALTQHLKILSNYKTKEDKPFLNFQVIENSEKTNYYSRVKANAPEIISDLEVDYLLLVDYFDMNDKFRLNLNLYSYDIKNPITEKHIGEYPQRKSLINLAINDALVDLINEMFGLGYIPVSGKEKVDTLLSQHMKENKKIRIPDVRRNKGIGARIGITSYRNSPDLFLGKNSGICIELFFCSIIPITFLQKSGLDLAIEPSVAYDIQNVLFEGPVGANGFINMKLIFSGFKYSNLPVILIGGVGFGGQGVWFNLEPGKLGYVDSSDYSNSVARFAFTAFTELEFPLSERIHLTTLFRYTTPSDVIREFEKIKVKNTINTPVGKLGGTYLLIGLKYNW